MKSLSVLIPLSRFSLSVESSNIHTTVPIFEKVPVRESSRNIVWNIPFVNARSSSRYADPTEKIKSPTLAADDIQNGWIMFTMFILSKQLFIYRICQREIRILRYYICWEDYVNFNYFISMR